MKQEFKREVMEAAVNEIKGTGGSIRSIALKYGINYNSLWHCCNGNKKDVREDTIRYGPFIDFITWGVYLYLLCCTINVQ